MLLKKRMLACAIGVACYSVLAPAKTPQPIVRKLNAEIVRILRLPRSLEFS